MLANSEFLVMLNQAATDRAELARLLNISDNQLSQAVTLADRIYAAILQTGGTQVAAPLRSSQW